MGKVKDVESASKPAKPFKGKPGGNQPNTFVMFFLNLGQTGLFKPMQGWYARLYTALGLGVIAALALGFGWLIFRIAHFQPFAEFLIATEAEMNKVSWTSKEDLYRATTVVLATVVLMAVFLFVVDWLWLFILRNIGVLQFTGGGGFGSTA